MPLVILPGELAQKYNVTPSQLALNWLIQFNDKTVFVIPGATEETHFNENRGANIFSLSEEDMDRPDMASAVFK